MKNLFIVATALLVAALGMVAPHARPVHGATTISFWIRQSDQRYAQPVVDAYNAGHTTQVKVTLIPDEQFVPTFGAAVAAGAPPDVVSLDLVYLPAFAAAHDLTEITALAHKLSYFPTLSPAHVRLATYQGQLYGLPFSAGGSVLMYNKKLFRRAGLNPNDPPHTWAAMEQDARKITALGDGIYGYDFPADCSSCYAFTFLPFIWASRGDVLTSDGRRATLTSSPPMKAALTLYRRLWTEHLIAPTARTDDYFTPFGSGAIGMAPGPYPDYSTSSPRLDYGVTYLPGMNGGWSSFIGGDTIGIPRGSRHASAAWDFITWCLSAGIQVNQFAANGSVPVRTDLAINRYTKHNPRFALEALTTARGRTPYSLYYNQLFNDQNSPWLAMIKQAVFGGQIDQAIATAQRRFTRILSRSM